MTEKGWLQISTEGFAAFNKDRPKHHLVKELVQNALDAVDDAGGVVALDWRSEGEHVVVRCRDDGVGVLDLSAMRVVYLTFKQDSHLRRGRFGRGFKEILSVAEVASVTSGGHRIDFEVENGEKVTRLATLREPLAGTLVDMRFRWSEDDIAPFAEYFGGFIVPARTQLVVNGVDVRSAEPRYRIEAQLPTEVFFPETSSWRRPRRKTTIELVRVAEDVEPFIYELGIPVAAAEWKIPYHANIAQRVPMNPNRDALASGFAQKIHAACLPIVLPDLDAEQVAADWVGAAGVTCAPDVQKEILAKAFGDNAVRSVPAMGKRDFDDDATRAGAQIVKTGQMSGGFREMAKAHLPTAREVVIDVERKRQIAVVEKSFDPTALETAEERDPRLEWVERRGGVEHVNRCLGFSVWFCQRLLDETARGEALVTGRLALGADGVWVGAERKPFMATWSADNVLTLALEVDCFWDEPLGAESLRTLIHEAAHARNLHHGAGFHSEVERLAGVAAAAMLRDADAIRARWGDLMRAG